jgi:hypothetical protein
MRARAVGVVNGYSLLTNPRKSRSESPSSRVDNARGHPGTVLCARGVRQLLRFLGRLSRELPGQTR